MLARRRVLLSAGMEKIALPLGYKQKRGRTEIAYGPVGARRVRACVLGWSGMSSLMLGTAGGRYGILSWPTPPCQGALNTRDVRRDEPTLAESSMLVPGHGQ